MSNMAFDFDAFILESKNTLLNPKSYFSGMKVKGGMIEPVVKAAIYGLVSGIIYLIFYFFKIKVIGAGYVGEAVGFPAFVKIIFSAIAGLYIGAVILMAISYICKGITDFEPNLRATSSFMVLMPVYSVLSISWSINNYLGMALSFILFVYFLWLLYHALAETLACKREYARIVCYVFAGLIILFLSLNLKSSGNQDNLKKDIKRNQKESGK